MVVYKDFNSIKKDEETVLTIGTFDGLHIGHKQIIETVVRKAKSLKCRSLLITFEPHPRTVLLNGNTHSAAAEKKSKVELLTSFEDKASLINELGIDNLLVIEFTREFAETSSQDFFVNYIYDKIGVKEIILGHDHKFGKNRGGDNNLLHSLGKEYNFSVNTLSPVSVDGEVVSSTRIRHLLKEGNINKVNQFLDREYSLKGIVVHGDMRGRRIGFPTANIEFSHSELLVPPKGVYAVRVIRDNVTYTGMMNIGTRPSFTSGVEIITEVHILNFSEEIYGNNLEIRFVDRIRDEMKFNGAEELKGQIVKDIEYTRSLFNN
ncbi:MAG: bifunctional riboflavin kinase/FAD synthetase [Ignavibacteriaceae bacterium]